MEETRYVFHLSPYDVSALLPQVSRALEAQTEHTSRAQYPGMWRQTDRLRERARARALSRRRSVCLHMPGYCAREVCSVWASSARLTWGRSAETS